MSLLAILKILTIPILLWLVAEVSKRFGSLVGGVVSGLPLISGPITLFIALEQGTEFARMSAWGAYPGMITYVGFGLVFVHLALRTHWFLALIAALTTYFVSGWIMMSAPVPVWVWPALSIVAISVGVRFMPTLIAGGKVVPQEKYKKPPYMQMICGAILMLIITTLAKIVGPTFSGILMFFPVIGGILGVFLLRYQYFNNAINLYKGAFTGMYTGWVFMLTLIVLLPYTSMFLSFVMATTAALAMSVYFVLRAKAKRN